jgi:hypothetical protein
MFYLVLYEKLSKHNRSAAATDGTKLRHAVPSVTLMLVISVVSVISTIGQAVCC